VLFGNLIVISGGIVAPLPLVPPRVIKKGIIYYIIIKK
jgi:hypothetical protein